jgi:hypothetical protein
MDPKISYVDKVYLYSSGMSSELVERSKIVLNEHGVDPNDIIIITIWPHYLSVAKVKRVREGSIYAPQLFNIDI